MVGSAVVESVGLGLKLVGSAVVGSVVSALVESVGSAVVGLVGSAVVGLVGLALVGSVGSAVVGSTVVGSIGSAVVGSIGLPVVGLVLAGEVASRYIITTTIAKRTKKTTQAFKPKGLKVKCLVYVVTELSSS